jgi:hypothetical protein
MSLRPVTNPASAGFYAENLLIYSKQAQEEGLIPLPVGENNKFAPIALGVSSVFVSDIDPALIGDRTLPKSSLTF